MSLIRRRLNWFRLFPIILCTTFALIFAVSPAYAATITVNTLDDLVVVDGSCSLREAVSNANSGAVNADCTTGSTSSADTDIIVLNVSGTYTLTAGQLSIGFNSRIEIQEGAGVEATISGNNASRIFSITSSSQTVLTFSGLTLRDGNSASDGGCISVSGSSGSFLDISDSRFENCNAVDQGGAIYVLGISHGGSITNTDFVDNTAGTQGGAIYINGTAIGYGVDESDFSQNEAGTNGGAIFATLSGGLGLTDSTFSDNFVDNGGVEARGGALWLSSQNTMTMSGLTFNDNSVSNGTTDNKGGALYFHCGTLNLSGSVFDGNTSSGIGGAIAIGAGTATCSNIVNLNVSDTRIESNTATTNGGAIYSETNDTQTISTSCLVGNSDTALYNAGGSSFTADGGGNSANSNWWGTNWGPQIVDAGGNSALSPGDSINGDGIDPVNVELSDANSSPPTGSWLTTAPTVAGAPCAGIMSGFVVTKTADTNDGVCDADCSLREAVTAANASAGADMVSLSVNGTYTLSSDIAVTSDVTVQESPGITATLSGGNTTRLFTISTTFGALTLEELTVQNGSATTAGGCIQVGASSGGSLTFSNGTLQNCVTTNSGGAIGTSGAVHSITISGSTLQNNTAGINGGAISETGTASHLSISSSSFSGNRAGNSSNAQGGAILFAGQGAAGASFSITDSTFNTNLAQSSSTVARGGAIHFTASDAALTGTISGSTFTDNEALNGSSENSGGALYKGGTGALSVSDSVFTSNSAAEGGAVYANQGTMSVTTSRIESNTATGNGDGYYTVSGVTDTISGSCIVNNGDTAVYDAEAAAGVNTTATGNWWGSSWGPQITAAGGNSALSPGDSINGNGSTHINVGLTDPNSTPPTGNWLTTAPTVAGALCAEIVPPDVTISPGSVNVNEGSSTDFTITRTGSTASDLVVTVNLSQQTGLVNADYELTGGSITGKSGSQTVTIPAGQASVAVTFSAVQDADAEAGNSLLVILVDGASYNLGAATMSAITISPSDTAVTNTNNSGDGSLRQAITNANSFFGADFVTFQASANGTITLTSNLPDITGTLTITGNGAANTIISGNDARRVLTQASGTLTLSNLTIRDGFASGDVGGGMYAGGVLNVSGVHFIDNVSFDAGGAIFVDSTSVSIVNSIFHGNQTQSDEGGALFAQADSGTLTNNLFYNNTAATNGGAYELANGTYTVTNVTVSNNTAPNGAVVAANATVNLRNSIVANSTGSNCFNGPSVTLNAQNSLIEGDLACVNGTNTSNLTGDPALDASYQLTSSSPAINAGNNSLIPGGVTTDLAGNARIQQTTVDMGAYESAFTPPLPDVTISPPLGFTVLEGANANYTITRTGDTTSALIVTVNIAPDLNISADYTLSGGSITGQSGTQMVTIPAGQASVNVNIAAVEDIEAEANNSVWLQLQDGAAYNLGTDINSTATIPQNDFGVTNTLNAGDGTLRQAITNANFFASDDTITFTVAANGTITLTSALPLMGNNGTLTIAGNGPTNTIIDGNNARRAFDTSATTLSVSNMTIQNGLADGENGGAIRMNGGVLTVRNVHFTNNTANTGGAIHAQGTVTVIDSIFTDNTAVDRQGGAIFNNFANLTVTNSAFSGNHAEFYGGGIYSLGGTAVLTVTNSTFSGNSSGLGGQIGAALGGATINNSILANHAGNGDCIHLSGTMTVENTLIEDGSCGINNGVDGNLTGDPALNGDLTLTSGSIAVDAGDDSLIPGGVTTDLAGNDRTQGARVDMGAYESSFTALPDVTISPAAFNVNENANANYTITRTGSTTSSLAVAVNITQGTGTVAADYTLSAGSITGQSGSQTVTIPAGQASVNVNFAAADDVSAEPANTLTMALVDGAAYNLGATTSSTATIPANDTVVTNTNDSGEGSLRQAITNANAFAATDTITFTAAANGTITLASPLPALANNGGLTITGNGTSSTTISGNDARRIFLVSANATVFISNLTLTRGFVATGQLGGAIQNLGTLDVSNSTISLSSGGDNGGAIYNAGSLSVTSTAITGNDAVHGGAIFNEAGATATFLVSQFTSNQATLNGGAIYNTGTISLTNGTYTNNSATTGGGFFNAGGTATLTGESYFGNSATSSGGIQNNATLNVSRSTFSSNTANNAAGLGNSTTGTATIVNSLFDGNDASTEAGGIGNAGSLTLINSTLHDNDAPTGAGLFATSAGSTTNVRNTIIANSTGGSDCARNAGTINAQNSLIEGGLTCVNGTNTGNLTGDPALAVNLRLTAGSIAVDAGDDSLIPAGVTTDLANQARIQGARVDMGAYESAFTALPNVTISPATFNVNEGANANYTITRTGSTTSSLAVTVNITQGTGTVAADYTLSGGSISAQSGSGVTVTIPAGQASVNVNLAATNDEIDEANEMLTVDLVDGASYNLGASTTSTATIVDNDVAGITVTPTSGLVTTEAGGTATFTVVLNSQPTADVTIGLSSSDTTEGTVSPNSLTFTNSNWNVAQTVTVTGVNDAVDDGDIAYSIVTAAATSSDTGYNGLNAANVSVTNNDNDTAGVTVNPTSGLVTTEAGGTATFTVVLNSQPTADVTVNLSSSDTSEGSVSPSAVTFTSGNWNTAQTVTITGVNDALDDGDIAYNIVTAAATSSDMTYNGVNTSDVSVTNTDNDTAGITVTPTSGLVTTEAGGTATFTIALNSQPTADVTVNLSSSDTTEGSVSPSAVTFTSGNWNTAQTVTITGVNDALDDGDIAYNIVTAAATSSDTTYNGVNTSDVSVMNTDNDTAGITVTPTSGLVTTEAGGTATFTVVLNSQPTADVVIGLSSNDTTEGTVSPTSLTFTNGNWNVAQTVTVTGVNDFLDDGDIAYSIVTAAATSSDTTYNGLNAANVSVTNNDNDTAGITVNPTSGLVTTEAGGTATFTIVLNTQPSADVTIGLSSNDTTEGTVSPSSVTFTNGNWNVAQTVTVTGVDDLLVDGNVGYSIVTAAATSSDTGYNGLNAANVSVTNNDNDTAGITVNPTSGLITTEAGGTATFTVVLNTQPTADVTIGLSSNDTTEGTVSPTSVTFTNGNWNTAQTVTVTGVNDFIVDGNIAYTIVTAAAVSSDGIYNGLNPADVNVSNTDNDAAGITVNPTSGLVTTEAGGTATFTVVLNSQPTSDVTIALSSSDTTEGTVSPPSLTFTNGNWNTTQTVTVTGVNDAVDDGDIAYTIVTSAAESADAAFDNVDPANVSVTNTDNDTAGITVNPTSGLVTTEAGGTATFTVVLNSQPTADVVIGLSSSDTTEGTVSPTSLTFTNGNWNVAQTVTVTGINDALVDGNLAYSITAGGATSADTSYSGINAADVSVTNTDNDVAGITVNPTSGLVTTEAGGTATFTVVLNTQPTADVTIGLSSSDTTEGTVSPTSVTFTNGNWNVAQTVTITGVNDALVDGNIAYTIVTAAAVSSDTNYNGVNPADVSVTNTDTTIPLTTLTVQLTLQARPAAPNAAYIISGEVEVRPTAGGTPILSTTFTSDNMGRFTLNNVPAGMYDVWIKGDRTLGRLHKDVVVAVGGGSTLTTALLLEGDGNDDGIISILDFSILSTSFGTRVGDADYDARADFNMDGVINLIDFSLLASNFAVEGDL